MRTGADGLSFLQPRGLLARALLFEETEWSQYRLLDEFFPLSEMAVYAAENFVLPEMEEAMRLGLFHAQPATPDSSVLARYGGKLARPLFQDQSARIPANYAAQTQEFANASADFVAGDRMRQGILADLERHYDETLVRLGGVIRRTWAWWVNQLLSAASSFTITVDGVSVTYSYGVNTDAASGKWSNAGTDTVYDMQELCEAHHNACGMYPTHAIFGADIPKYLAMNDAYLAFAQRFPEYMRSHALPTIGLNLRGADGREGALVEIVATDAYRDSSHTVQRMWPALTMALITKVPGLTVHASARNAKNDWNGGLGTWRAEDARTKEMELFASDNRFFGLAQPQCVTIVNLNP